MTHFTNGVGAGAGLGAGMALANALFSRGRGGQAGERPVWSDAFNETNLMVMAHIAANGMTTGLYLYGIEDGACVFLGARRSPPQMMALFQQWGRYLTEGHTVREWCEHLPPLPPASNNEEGARR